MKCSSRRNFDAVAAAVQVEGARASMKCSSRRDCKSGTSHSAAGVACLNEVQFPKELQAGVPGHGLMGARASMKCSSRRNCDTMDDSVTKIKGQPQ